jgi:hypothetical protein
MPANPATRRHLRTTALLALVAAAVIALSPSIGSSATYQLPTTIAHDCSVDVTQPILSFIGTVPNGAVVSFAGGACYRVEGTLELDGRSGLDLEGNGATFKSLNAPSDQRAMWRIVDSSNIKLQNMVVQGSYKSGGTFTSSLQHAHAVDVRGSSVDLGGLTMTDVAGDCVYFGLGWTSTPARSTGTLHDSTCLRTGRNAVAVAAGDNIVVQRVTTGTIGYDVFDVEPNSGAGFGSNNVTFDGNSIGSSKLNAYSVVESGPVANQSFTNNRFVGVGARIAVSDPASAGYRAQGVRISGNSSTVPQPPAAINVDNVDGLTISGNSIPVAGGPMAAITASCGIAVSGNSYPGGSQEALVYPYANCTQTSTPPPPPPPTAPAPPTVTGLSPSSGPVGTAVTVTGSNFTEIGSVTVGGVSAVYTISSAGKLVVTVPSGAASGPVTVTTAAGSASSATFTVTAAAPTTRPPHGKKNH